MDEWPKDHIWCGCPDCGECECEKCKDSDQMAEVSPTIYSLRPDGSGEIYYKTKTRTIPLNELLSAMEEILERPIGKKKDRE